MWVPLIWTSSWNVKLMLANDTIFVERLPGRNASTRSVGCKGLALMAPATETDVFSETSNMFMTAVLGPSASKRVWIFFFDRARQEAGSCGVPSISCPTADPELQDDPAGSEHARWPPPRRVPVLDNRCKTVGSALVMPRLPCVLRNVLPSAA